MPTGAEALTGQSQMQAALDSGIEQISARQEVTFTQYRKWTFAQDGYVFWAATTTTVTVLGSLHYMTDRLQDVDQTIGANQVILTSEQEVTAFNLIAPETMWIADWPLADGASLQIAFAQRANYYVEADVWHYVGYAVYPAMSSQIVNSPADLPVGPIVSNSLPIWLAQNSLAPVYPSFLVPDNVAPPYIVAHIAPEGTTVLSAAPLIGPWPGTTVPNSGSSPLHDLAWSQFMRDDVELILYGFTNASAIQFLQGLYEASIDGTAPFGFANSPGIVDAKRPQVEIAALAQKKQIRILANYYQGAADAIARRLILSADIRSVAIVGGNSFLGAAAGSQAAQTGSAQGTVTYP